MTDPRRPMPRLEQLAAELEQFPLDRVSGQTFSRTTVYLDGYAFENCTFKDCELVIRLGRFTLRDNTFDGCKVSAAPGSIVQGVLELDALFRLGGGRVN